MRVIEPGHIYELETLDGDGRPVRFTFVNREGTPHSGIQTQEALRLMIDLGDALIDRTNHCDACLRWEGNDRIVKSISEAQRQLRLALINHEHRAQERKLNRGDFRPERAPTDVDGHFPLP